MSEDGLMTETEALKAALDGEKVTPIYSCGREYLSYQRDGKFRWFDEGGSVLHDYSGKTDHTNWGIWHKPRPDFAVGEAVTVSQVLRPIPAMPGSGWHIRPFCKWSDDGKVIAYMPDNDTISRRTITWNHYRPGPWRDAKKEVFE